MLESDLKDDSELKEKELVRGKEREGEIKAMGNGREKRDILGGEDVQ